MTDKIIANFFSQFRLHTYKKGEMILSSADTPPGIFYIQSGFVKQSLISPSGSELIIHIYEPKSHFPMSWALNDTSNRYNFTPLTHAQIFIAPKAKVVEFFNQNPQALYLLSQRLLKGLDGLSRRIEVTSFEHAYGRLVSILLYLAAHFGEPKARSYYINHKFTHTELAAMTGLSRERISLEMEKLEKAKLVRYSNHHLIISDIKRLEKTLSTSSEL